MNQWYKSNITKGILIVAEHVLAGVAVISLIWMQAYPALIGELISGKQEKKYENTSGFSEQIQTAAHNVLEGIAAHDLFDTEGKYNPDKVVDIKEYKESGTISNNESITESSGLLYRLGDLAAWGKTLYSDGDSGNYNLNETASVIVCKRTDGTFSYYYYDEFENLIRDGQLKFIMADNSSDSGGALSDEILASLKSGYLYQGNNAGVNFKGLQNSEGKIEYIDCWNYDGYRIEEKYAPLNANNILEVVNSSQDWNGKLNDVYQTLSNIVNDIYTKTEVYETSDDSWKEGDTNFAYLYVNTETKQVYTNREAFKDYKNIEKSTKAIFGMGKYVKVEPKLSDFQTNIKDTDADNWRSAVKYIGPAEKEFLFVAGVDTSYPIQDAFYSQNANYEKYGTGIWAIAILGIAASVLWVVGIVWLTIIAGRTRKDEELHLNWFDHWKTELAAAVIIFIWLGLVMLAGISVSGMSFYKVKEAYSYINMDYRYQMIPNAVVAGTAAVYTCGMFLLGYLSLVRRIKGRVLWQNSILKGLLGFMRVLFVNMHFVWKTVIFFCAFVIIHWVGDISGGWVVIMLVAELSAFIYLIRGAVGRQRIRTGIEQVAAGEVNYKIPLDGLTGEQLMLAERVNSIGEGLNVALEESMKSERLKTDLITNVSHDIKTPLTSIINYVNLLKLENFDDPKIQRYLEVLEEKAQRLKTLTEDVVEASKVSSGNITLEFMNINLVEMIQQTSGEFEEKFKGRNLSEVLNLPEDECIIRADGRRMWRVLENIYNNAAKYAMEGSRIYADLQATDREVIFSLKNVSEQALNISADELTERFIRGDVSRSTEGSGLGLSIAKSLTTMQGGRFDLYLDGDLFKVTITFPRVVKLD